MILISQSNTCNEKTTNGTAVLQCRHHSFGTGSENQFGKITPEQVGQKIYFIDSHAHAVVLSDVGSTSIIGNSKGGFSLEFKRHRRVHILNKNAYDEADIEIDLYTNDNATEKLENLKAATYNLEGGKIVEAEFEKDNLFTEKRSRHLVVKKFTLPNVKEGSVIEYEYKITSDFLTNLQPWTFQERDAPVLWSEYKLSLPSFLDYVFLSQGFQTFHIKDQKDGVVNFTVSDAGSSQRTERSSFSAPVTTFRWVMKDLPELKEENFTSSISNYLSRIEFQLSGLKEPLNPRKVMDTWQNVTKQMLEDDEFGYQLTHENNWLGDVVRPLTTGKNSDLEKAKSIYDYVRDNITCTNSYGIYTSQSLKNTHKTRNGRVSEVNLLLVAMLKYANLHAEPVILSLKERGFTHPFYPLLSRFNYVVAGLHIDGRLHYLDATHPRLGFGKLLPDCYNGYARFVNTDATQLELWSDSLRERKVTSVYLTPAEKGGWSGSMNQTLGYFESYNIRKKIGDANETSFFNEIKTHLGNDVKISNTKIDSLSRLEDPVALKYEFTLPGDDEDIIYLNPIFAEGYKENPFKSAIRYYPVEMPYTFDETYLATIVIPEGYKVDELPKGIRVNLNEQNEGSFEYLISHSGNTISMRSRVKLSRATFNPDEYDYLREFFNLVVGKQKEQIVLKKTK